jgi:quinol monooxygenase YgiN
MIIVMGEFNVAPEDAQQYMACRADRIRKSRLEPGCLEYTYSADPLSPGRVILSERWDSAETFATHVATVKAEGLALPGDVPVISAAIKRFEATGEQVVNSAEVPK